AALFSLLFHRSLHLRHLHSFPTRRSSDLSSSFFLTVSASSLATPVFTALGTPSTRSFASFRPRLVSSRTTLMTWIFLSPAPVRRSEEHTSELQSRENLVCRLLLEKKNIKK